ncbi:MAG: peptidase M56, partial [Christiangramia sp.]
MESFLIYILKASALLGIFYLSYLLLLKKDTSFQLNRKFLISGIVTSAVLPALYLTRKVYIEASSQVYNYIPTSEVSSMPIETPTDWWQIAGITYLIITGFFLLRLVHQLRL